MEFETKNKKKNTLFILIGMLAIITLVSVASLNNSITENSVHEGQIKVGVVAPLTGGAGSYGNDIRKGIDIALEDIDPNNEIRVIYEDACLAQDAIKSIEKLVLIDQVDLVSGVFCIIAVEPIATRTAPQKISVTMSAAVPDSIIESNNYVFSPNSAIKDEAYAQAEFVYNEHNSRTASIVWMNTDFGITYSKHFNHRFEELGGTVLTNEPLDVFGVDYKTQLTKVKSSNPDTILAVHFGNQMALILKQSRELGIDSPIIGTYESEDQKILDVAGNAAEGLIFTSPVGKNFGEKAKDFEEKYTAKYGEEPTPVARMAYDGFIIQIEAYEFCEGDRECIIKYLHNVKDHDGASGKFSINEDGTADREFVFKVVRGGEFVKIK